MTTANGYCSNKTGAADLKIVHFVKSVKVGSSVKAAVRINSAACVLKASVVVSK